MTVRHNVARATERMGCEPLHRGEMGRFPGAGDAWARARRRGKVGQVSRLREDCRQASLRDVLTTQYVCCRVVERGYEATLKSLDFT